MARFEDGSYGTAAGVALIGKVLAGRCKMEYTRVAVGKGIIPEDMTPKTMTDAADYVMDAKIAAVTNPIDGECQVTVQVNSADVEHGFYCTCVVLFARDPDEGEVPYTYLVLENEPEWIRPASSIVGKLATFDLIAAVGDVDAVYATIDPEAIATVARVAQMIEEHNEDPEAHGASVGTCLIIEDFVIPAEGWYEHELTDPDYADTPWAVDIPVEYCTEAHFPLLALHRSSQRLAEEAGLSSQPDTLAGAVRFFAETVPAGPLTGTLTLRSASAPDLGLATDQEVEDAVDDVYGEGSADALPEDYEVATDEEVQTEVVEGVFGQ